MEEDYLKCNIIFVVKQLWNQQSLYLLGSLFCYLFIFKVERYLLRNQGIKRFLIPPVVLQIQAKNVGIYLP